MAAYFSATNIGNYRLERRYAIIISEEARPGLWVDGVDRCRVIELDACAAHADRELANASGGLRTGGGGGGGGGHHDDFHLGNTGPSPRLWNQPLFSFKIQN